MWASTSPVLSWGGAESGSSCNVEDTWSWRLQKIVWTVDSIGSFVLDISVIADRNAFSHPATWDIATQSFWSSSRAWRSQLRPTKSLISPEKSKAQPKDDSIKIYKKNLRHDIRIIWWVEDHRVFTSRISIKDRWRVEPFRPRIDASSWLNQACLRCGLDLMARMILRSWKTYYVSMNNSANKSPCRLQARYFPMHLEWRSHHPVGLHHPGQQHRRRVHD